MRHPSVALLLCCVLSPVLAAPSEPAPTAESLAAKNVEAHGGAASLKAISTLIRNGKLLVNGDQIRLDFTEMQKRDGKVREEASLQGLTVVQAWDGSEGWQVNPFQGRKDAERTPPDDSKGLIEDGEIGGVLADYAARKESLEYVGTEDVDGTPALKLKLTRANGDVRLVFLDPVYFLEIRTISQRKEHGVPVEIQTDYGEYEKVAGVYVPFSVISGRKGSTDVQKTLFDKGEANKPIDDAKFAFPAPHVTVGPAVPGREPKK
ncbi:MAG: hypothetical protein NVS9B10_08620 [Nevskia sp.]